MLIATYLALVTNNAGPVLNGVGMRKIESIRNGSTARAARRAPARILLLKLSTARINDSQIHRHKVKRSQWCPLPSSLLVARTKLPALQTRRGSPLLRIFRQFRRKVGHAESHKSNAGNEREAKKGVRKKFLIWKNGRTRGQEYNVEFDYFLAERF